MKSRVTDDQYNALNAEVTHLKELMACGHPGACIKTSEEGTDYCAVCESLGGYIADADDAKAKLSETEKARAQAQSWLDKFQGEVGQKEVELLEVKTKLVKTTAERDDLRQKMDRAAADVSRSEKMVASLAAVTTERDQLKASLAALEVQLQKKLAAPDGPMKALQEMADGGCRCSDKPCRGGCGAFVLAANSALIRASSK